MFTNRLKAKIISIDKNHIGILELHPLIDDFYKNALLIEIAIKLIKKYTLDIEDLQNIKKILEPLSSIELDFSSTSSVLPKKFAYDNNEKYRIVFTDKDSEKINDILVNINEWNFDREAKNQYINKILEIKNILQSVKNEISSYLLSNLPKEARDEYKYFLKRLDDA